MLKYTVLTSILFVIFILVLISTSFFIRYRHLAMSCYNAPSVNCYTDWTCPTIGTGDTGNILLEAQKCFTDPVNNGGSLYQCMFGVESGVISQYLTNYSNTGSNSCNVLADCTTDTTTGLLTCPGKTDLPTNCSIGCFTDLTAFNNNFGSSAANSVCGAGGVHTKAS